MLNRAVVYEWHAGGPCGCAPTRGRGRSRALFCIDQCRCKTAARRKFSFRYGDVCVITSLINMLTLCCAYCILLCCLGPSPSLCARVSCSAAASRSVTLSIQDDRRPWDRRWSKRGHPQLFDRCIRAPNSRWRQFHAWQ